MSNKIPKLKFILLLIILTAGIFSSSPASAAVINKSNATPPSLNTGLVGWWTMDGRDVTSTAAIDMSGSGNNGTRTGGKITIGKLGQAMSFNGTTDKITTPLITTANANVSFGGWANLKTIQNSIIFYNGDSGSNGYGLRLTSDGLIHVLNGGLVLDAVNNTTFTMSTNRWTHVFAVLGTSGAWTLYLDGVAIKQGTSVPTAPGTSSLIGSASTEFWNGALDDIRIYSRALSAAEVQQLYKLGGGKINKTPTVPPTLKTGLVGWWTFDGKDVTTTAAIDKGSGGNNGARNGTTVVTTGKIGQAMKFDGSSGFAQVKSSEIIQKKSYSSVSAWIKMPAGSTSRSIYGESIAAGIVFTIYVNASGLPSFYIYDGADHTAAGVVRVDDNRWHFLTATYNSGAMTIYVDGVSVGNSSANVLGTAIAVSSIGRFNAAQAGYFNGIIDDVRAYERVLSPREVQQLYKLGGGKINKTPTVPPTLKTGLVGWWTMDGRDTTAVTTTEKSGLGIDGTRTGGTKMNVGKIGQAIGLNGTTGYSNILDYANFNISNSFTLSAWVKPKEAGGAATDSGDTIIGKTSSYGVNGIEMEWLWTNSVKPAVQWYGSDFTYGPANNYPVANRWNHMVAVYNGTTITYYLNGVSDGGFTPSNPPPNTAFDIRIGTISQRAGGYFMNGSIDDVRVYNRALSARDVTMLYRTGR